MALIESIAKISSIPSPAMGLLPAVHYASPVSTITLPASPVIKTVYKNDSQLPIILPQAGKWPSRQMLPGALFAYDGRMFYPVVNKIGTTSYYPKDFERVIYNFSFNKYTLPVKASYTFERLFYMRLLANNVLASWSIIFEYGIRVDDVSPEIEISRQATLTLGQKTVSTESADGIVVGMFVSGEGVYNELDAKSYVSEINGNIIKLNRPVSVSGSRLLTFRSPTGPNIGSINWLPPVMEFTVSLTELKSVNPIGTVITNYGEKAGDPARNEIGMSGFVKLFERAMAAPVDSLPTQDNFYLRIRLGNFDTENGVSDPTGYVAYVIRAIDDPEPEG